MANKVEAVRFALTVPVVMGHPNLIEPKAFKRNGQSKGDPKYGAIFCIDPNGPDFAGLKEAMAKAAKAFNPNADLKALKFPMTSGEKAVEKYRAKKQKEGKSDDGKADFQLGKYIVKASSKYQPQLAVLDGGKAIDITPDNIGLHKNKFYFGVQAVAEFNFVGYEGQDGNPDGVTAYLNSVLSLNRGERLTGGSAAETFKGVIGNFTSEDPTGGAGFSDDEMSFA